MKAINAKNTHRQCVELEEKASAIYLQMASRFSVEIPELSALWLDIGMQEKRHAGLLQFCAIEGMITPPESNGLVIERIELGLQDLAARAEDPALSIEDAFQIAIALETSELNNIYQYLTTPLHCSMYLLRRKIMSTTPDHKERLFREGRKYGVSESALRRLERDSCTSSSWQ